MVPIAEFSVSAVHQEWDTPCTQVRLYDNKAAITTSRRFSFALYECHIQFRRSFLGNESAAFGDSFTNIFNNYFTNHPTSYAREATAHPGALDNS